MSKKLTRGQKAWATRKANQLKNKQADDNLLNDLNIGSTMILLEQAIDALIQRINLQTQRIKDMM